MKTVYKRWWRPTSLFTFSLLLSLVLAVGIPVLPQTLAQVNINPRNQAVYVTMRDGIKIAVDVWLPNNLPAGSKIPTIIRATRYWRAVDWIDNSREANPNTAQLISPYNQDIDTFNKAGYAVVLVDARGTGASFGRVSVPYSPEEIKDYGEVIDWVAKQAWSNQKVGAYGVSYDGNTAEMMASNNHPALKAIVPQFNDFDVYAHLLFPGGVFNEAYLKGWSQGQAIFDTSVCRLNIGGKICEQFKQAGFLGVKPVDADKDLLLLAAAAKEHTTNINIYEAVKPATFRDDALSNGINFNTISPYNLRKEIEHSNVAIYGWGSWYDAGTALGVVNRFMTFRNPQKAIIGAWTHGAYKAANPYLPPDSPATPPREQQLADIIEFFDGYLKDSAKSRIERELKYYTLAEDKWKTTKVWPPVGVKPQRWYLAANNNLTTTAPSEQSGEDKYTVNYEATTGQDTRWAQNFRKNNYPDRVEEDKKLLTYTSDPVNEDVEITGNPVISIFAKSTSNDGAFYGYLEDVDENDKVFYVTEGQLRPLHRKISNERPPYQTSGVYHSFEKKDALPVEPGQLNELTFNMLPTSVLIKKGHRIRVAIAGHDKDNFARYGENSEITIERNSIHPSYIDLPIMR